METYNPPKDIFARNKGGIKVKMAERVEYPPEGGIYTYYEGMKYPKKGAPFPQAVIALEGVKSAAMQTLSFLSRNKWILPFVFILRKKFLKEFMAYANKMLSPYYLKPERYCISAKEVYDTLKRLDYSDTICHLWAMLWEYDNAYRYRFQDIFTTFNDCTKYYDGIMPGALKWSIEVARGRENNNGMMKKWDVVLKLYSLVGPYLKKFVVLADIKKLTLDEADSYHCLVRPDYDFGGISWEDRQKIRKQIDEQE